MTNIPDVRLPDGTVGPPPAGLWEIGAAARAFGTDADTVVNFAAKHELPWCMFETNQPITYDMPGHGPVPGGWVTYTFVERAAFVRAWMLEHNR